MCHTLTLYAAEPLLLRLWRVDRIKFDQEEGTFRRLIVDHRSFAAELSQLSLSSAAPIDDQSVNGITEHTISSSAHAYHHHRSFAAVST